MYTLGPRCRRVVRLNALNTDAILTYNQGYSPTTTWPVATSVLTARSTKITVQWDF